MHQQLWGYKVEVKIYLAVCEQKMLNITRLARCSYTLSLTSALDGGECSKPRPDRFNPEKPSYPLYERLHGSKGRWENLVPTGIRSPDRPARSESLYWPRYPANMRCSSDFSVGKKEFEIYRNYPMRVFESQAPRNLELPCCLRIRYRKCLLVYKFLNL
jgi:rRNA maturation protein Nop10